MLAEMETTQEAESITLGILHMDHVPLTLDQIKAKLSNSIPDEVIARVLSKLTQENKIQTHSPSSISKKASTKSVTLYWTDDIFGNHAKENTNSVSNQNTPQKSVLPDGSSSKPTQQDTPKTPSSGLSKKRPQPFKSSTPFKTPWKSPSSDNSNNNTTTTHINKKLKVGMSTPTKLEELDVDDMTHNQLQKEVQRLSQMLSKKKEQHQYLKQQTDSNTNPQKLDVMNEDGKLDPLIKKWTRACQKVLLELQQKAKQETTIGALLDHFGVEEDLRKTLRYVPEMDEFQ